MELLDAIQWPAFATSVVAAWLVGANHKNKRNWGFWVFLLSNVLWIAWGVHTRAYALIALQVCLMLMNIRGLRKTEDGQGDEATDDRHKPGHGRSTA